MSDSESKLPDIAYVSELAKLFKRFHLDELEIETGEQRISMRRGGESGMGMTMFPQQQMAAPMPAPMVSAPLGAPTAVAVEAEGDYITSPFVGTFYSRPRPGEPSFISVGSTVAAGQTVCIVEAMKLFNEIEAEFGCVVEEFLVADQQPVEFGTKLFRVRRL